MAKLINRFNPPTTIAWLMFLLAFGMTVGFGTWQVERLHWKQGLMRELDEANAKAPLTRLPTSNAALDALQFHKVRVRGSWISGTEFDLTPRYLKDQFGYALITPLKLADGRILLVNRGWIPAAKKDIAMRPETKVRGAATVTGMIRTDTDRSYVTPANQPEKNIWFGRDIAEMAAAAHLDKVVPVMLDQTGDATTKKLPIPSDGIIRLRNDHLSYIITWYGIALGILIIFVTYHWRRRP